MLARWNAEPSDYPWTTFVSRRCPLTDPIIFQSFCSDHRHYTIITFLSSQRNGALFNRYISTIPNRTNPHQRLFWFCHFRRWNILSDFSREDLFSSSRPTPTTNVNGGPSILIKTETICNSICWMVRKIFLPKHDTVVLAMKDDLFN